MSIYFDTSALLPLFVPEQSSELVTRLVADLTRRPLLSDYGAGEFASAISRHVRSGNYTEDHGRTILTGFDRWTIRRAEAIETKSSDVRRAAAIVRRFELKLRFPDALHLAICNERSFTIVTRDRLMATAATQLGVGVELLD